MNTTDWGYYQQHSYQMQEVDELGSQLSIEIACPVHYPAFGKRLFECKCGVVFPVYLVAGKDWKMLKRKHVEERRYSLV